MNRCKRVPRRRPLRLLRRKLRRRRPRRAPLGNPKELYQAAQQRYAADDFSSAIKMFDDYLAKYPGA